MSEWSIDKKVIKDRDDGSIELDYTHGQTSDNRTDDNRVREILDKDGLDLDKVTSINLTQCELITDEALNDIAHKCSRLELLSITWCSNVTDEGIRSILVSNPNINMLNFDRCTKVTVDIINAIITHTPNMRTINAGDVGWSVIPDDIDFGTLDKLEWFNLCGNEIKKLVVIPDDIDFGTLDKLEWFNLCGNEIKKLPKSMINLPHLCSIYIDDNPLELTPMEMADDGHIQSPATIGRFYAEEMCARADFTLEMLDSHVKIFFEEGEKLKTLLDDVDRAAKSPQDKTTSASERWNSLLFSETKPEANFHSNCKIIMDAIRAQAGLSAGLLRECEERLYVVHNDKKLVQNLTHEGKPGLFLHAVCRSYYVTPQIIQFCITEFGTDIASKKNDEGLMPYDVLAANPCATKECMGTFNLVNDIIKMCATADFSLEMLDSHVKEYGVNCLHKVQVNGKTVVDQLSNAVGASKQEILEYKERLTVVRKDKKLIQSLTHGGKTGLHLHSVCKSYFVTPDIIQFCLDKFGNDLASVKDSNGMISHDILLKNPSATAECKDLIKPSNFRNIHQVGGVSDDPRNEKDCLGYDIYAEAIVDVVDKVEAGNTSNFSVGLFAPWGVGKSKLWYLIKGAIQNKEKKHMKEWIKNQAEDTKAEKDKANTDDRSVGSALFESFAVCCKFIDLCRSLVCRKQQESGEKFSEDAPRSETSEEISPLISPQVDNDNQNNGDDKEQGRSPETEADPVMWNAEEARDNETLAALMVVTWIFWFPFLLIYSPIAMCPLRLFRPLKDDKKAKIVSKIIAGEYIPIHIRSNDTSFGLSICTKTAIIFSARILPFTNVGNFCNRCLECFEVKPIPKADVNKHLFVEFNAWVYNGSDLLWASLMEKLWLAVEDEYGANAVRLHRASITLAGEKPDDNTPQQTKMDRRRLALYKFYFFATLSSILWIGATTLGILLLQKEIISNDDIEQVANATITNISDCSGDDTGCEQGAFKEGILLIIGAQIPIINTLWEFFIKVFPEIRNPRYKKFFDEEKNQRHDFSKETGFMGIVKREIGYLFDFLLTHDYPDTSNKCRRPTRLSIFLDDLDRCESKTVIDVLQAMKLLLDNEHNRVVTCYSAIDTRIIVACIDEQLGVVLRKSAVTGYYYLEKFIQLPFCIPQLSYMKKAEFMRRLFIDKYLRDPSLILSLIEQLQNKAKSDLDQMKEQASPDSHYVEDLEVLCETSLLRLHRSEAPTDVLAKFLNDVKNNGRTSKDLRDIFSNKKENLTDYNNDEKGNEEILCLATSYLQYFDSIYSTILEGDTSNKPDQKTTEKTTPNEGSKTSSSTEPELNHAPSIKSESLVTGRTDNNTENVFNPSDVSDIHHEPTVGGDSEDITNSPRGNVTFKSFVQSMVKPDENEWFKKYSRYLEGRPRSLKRIVNIYNVARGVAEKTLEQDLTPNFRQKLILSIIMVELWPYRTSIIFQACEDSLQEEELTSLLLSDDPKLARTSKRKGNSMEDIMRRFESNDSKYSSARKNSKKKLQKVFLEVSLYEVYQKVARVLMHASEQSISEIAGDSDPQLFEQLLLEKHGNSGKIMMMSDIIPIDDMNEENLKYGHTLRPFIFNMPSHMVEKASKSMENINIHIVDEGIRNVSEDIRNDSWCIKYELVEKCYEMSEGRTKCCNQSK
eukprot:CAMPEP_0194096296 /NCGR_PEP_ID=MMETSP0149-20130528/57269_1 /TAXON_ID=122233 /ORGANISM="Chaetoceros debilis, Strain MM31A-1" /LENGTH=1660 /DNA_ID=CAMNT_0038782267 /DNA_START=22 /DNA_END=5005 /DNA_ORIENTATION=+